MARAPPPRRRERAPRHPHRRAGAALVLLPAGRLRAPRRLPGARRLLLLRAPLRLQPDPADVQHDADPGDALALQPEPDGRGPAPPQHVGAAHLHRAGHQHAHVPRGDALRHLRAPPHPARARGRARARHHAGRHRRQGPGLLRRPPPDRPLPDAALGRVRALEVAVRRSGSLFGLLGLLFLAFGFVGTFVIERPLHDPYVVLNLIAGGGLLLAYLSFGFEEFRSLLGQRSTRYGAGALVYTLLFVLLVVGGNYISARRHHRWDLTEAGIYTLAPQSKKVVEALKEDLAMTGFVEGGQDAQLQSLLESHQYAAPGHV